jgi:hypothetical protein
MQSRPGGAEDDEDRAWQDSRGLGSSRTRVSAFGISLAVHVIAILLYTTVVTVMRPDAVLFPVDSDDEVEEGVVLIQLIDIDPDDPDRPDEPQEIEDVVAAEENVRPPFIPSPVIGELVPPGPTAAERLRPNLIDARIWAEPPPEFYALTIDEREELLLSHRIVEWYDSVALARSAEARLTDWTFRDSKGGRWGVADGRIYLGDLELPLPLNFGTPVGKRDETAYRMWEFDEIQRQSQQFLIEQNWKERSQAIRERRDRERAAARPDTTRIR